MYETLLFYKIKCIKSFFLLPQENGFRMLWKPFIIKICSCRRREVMLPSLLVTGTAWEETGAVQAAFRHRVSLEWFVPPLWHRAETACVWPGKCECRAAQLMQISAQSLWQEYTKDNSYCQVLLLGDYHSTFSFLFFCCCCLKSDKPNYISIANGQQSATKVSICFSVENNNFKYTSIEPFHTTEEANIQSIIW